MKTLCLICCLATTCLNLLQAQQFTWNTLPDNTYADTDHWPFVLGVASAEPDTNGVYLWVYAEPDSFTQANVFINWEMATDSVFTTTLQGGFLSLDSSTSYTGTFKVDQLQPDTYYWYRFKDVLGNTSVVGRTRTLPTDDAEVNLAVLSCSNIIAYYNTYGRVAELDNINAVVHLGDFAYDKLNQPRSVRYPDPAPTLSCELDGRRKRDYLTLLDPDLRRVRQMHPFFYLWDNHDVQKGQAEYLKDTCRQVFYDFTGQPIIDSSELAKQYRKVSIGGMVDLFIVDVQYTQDRRDTINGMESYLGQTQLNWLINGLQNSTAKWKLIGQQKLVSAFSVEGLESVIPNGVNSDEKAWDGYDAERTQILEFVRDNDIDNVMFLSGDAHFVVVADLPIDPFDSVAYHANSGYGSVAVEFLPSGISSPNINERGIDYSLGPVLQDIAAGLNPHQVYTEFMDNGYGVLQIAADSIKADVWLLDAQTVNTDQYLANTQILFDGDNHWYRSDTTISSIKPVEVPSIGILSIYPNPAKDELNVSFLCQNNTKLLLELIDLNGKVIYSSALIAKVGTNNAIVQLPKMAAGTYMVAITSGTDRLISKFVKQ